jgi:uncharacterized membrane protein
MRSEAKRWAVPAGLTLWCVVLVVLRVGRSGSLMYVFLCWNLFLAWIPWLAGRAFGASRRRRSAAALQLGWFALWLLFLPNAPYIATDLLHLKWRPPVPLWYDLALLLAFAGTGLLLGYLSLLDVQAAVEERFGRLKGWGVAAGSLFLAGFGVYLGRFLRWNSWEVLTDPGGLLRDIADRLLDPTLHLSTYGFTLIFGIGLLLGYAALVLVASSRDDRVSPAPVRPAPSASRPAARRAAPRELPPRRFRAEPGRARPAPAGGSPAARTTERSRARPGRW